MVKIKNPFPRKVVRRRLRKAQTDIHLVDRFGWLDRWLPRISHISQLGLFILTIGALYFTVIPLYQKALLEEAIAQKEVELKIATAALTAQKVEVMNVTATLTEQRAALQITQQALAGSELRVYVQSRDYELVRLLMGATADCSGLFTVLTPPKELGDRDTQQSEPFERALLLDPAGCATQKYKESTFYKNLRPVDKQIFDEKASQSIKELNKMRKDMHAAITEVVIRGQRDPSTLEPLGYFEARAEEFLERAARTLQQPRDDRRKFERAVQRTKNAMASRYGELVRKEINAWRNIAWPIKVRPTEKPR